MALIIPENYRLKLLPETTEIAIKYIKEAFQERLAKKLNNVKFVVNAWQCVYFALYLQNNNNLTLFYDVAVDDIPCISI